MCALLEPKGFWFLMNSWQLSFGLQIPLPKGRKQLILFILKGIRSLAQDVSSAVLCSHLLAQIDYIHSEFDGEDTEVPPVMFEDLLSTEEISGDLRKENVSIFLKGRKVECAQ